MKRQKRLTLLLAVLAVCIAVAFGLSQIDFEEKMTGTKTEIIHVDSSEITGLSWNYDGEVSFTCENEEWSYDGDEAMPVDQELLAEIAENLSNITSDKRVEEVKSLGLYGLDDPAYTVTVVADKTYEISIGDESFTDGEVYISAGDDYVYLTDAELIDEIAYSLYDLVEKEEIPEMESISSIQIEKAAPVKLVWEENSGYCYSDEYTYFLEDEDEYRNLDNEKAESTFDSLTAFVWEECVDYNAEDSELAAYGLDDPDAAVTADYKDADGEEQTFSYEIAEAGGIYYVRLADSRMVYTVSQDVYDAAVNASYDELKPDEVILLNWSDVDSIEIEMDGNSYTIEIERGEDEEYTCIYEGTEVDFSDVLDSLSGITAAEDPEEGIALGDGNSEIILTIHRRAEKASDVELAFYQYDGTYCIPVLDGEELDPVNREDVVSLKEAVNAIILDTGRGE